ncbi:hypothetical protein G6F56_006801 [Rhizopus delemar]|nr:hypothetical protein G6F56_006801 [Rhizopus delemar]
MYAIVRDVPNSFDQYCCFIEDTAVVVQDLAIINRLGDESRRKEIIGIEEGLRKVPLIKEIHYMHEIDPEATLDGGDVLYTGTHLFVGLSRRTNQRGADVLNKHTSLHFKCVVSMLDEKTLLVTDHEAVSEVVKEIESYTNDWYSIVKVPEQVPSNILSLSRGKVAVYQEGLKKTEDVKKPRSRHNKSHSTTSITKGSVILSSLNEPDKQETTPHDDDLMPQKRKTTIAFAEPNGKPSKKEQDDTSSISSSSLISVSSLDSSVSSLNSITDASFILVHKKDNTNLGGSTAVDALTNLASASTKNSFLADFDMPPIVLQGRKQDTEPVLTEFMAEKVY